MADFNIEMSPSQGAGGTPVSPVQVSPIPDNDYSGVIAKGLSIFSDFQKGMAKKEEKDRKNAAVQAYIQEAGKIAELRSAGKIDAGAASTLDKKNYYSMLAAHPESITELAEARRSLFEGTETGVTEDLVKQQKERERAVDTMALNEGWPIHQPNLPPEVQEAYRRAALASQAVDKKVSRAAALQSYNIAGEVHEETMRAKKEIQSAKADLTNLVAENYDAFAAMVNHAFATSKTEDEVQNSLRTINQKFADFKALANVPGASKELVNQYLAGFEQLHSFATQNLKAGMDLKSLEDQKKRIILTNQIAILQDRETAALVSASALIPNSAYVSMKTENKAIEAASRIINATPDTPLYKLPSVVGSSHEKANYDILEAGAKALNSGSVQGDSAKLSTELTNSLDVILRQADALSKDSRSKPQDLSKVMEFFAKPEIGKASEAGILPRNAAETMRSSLSAYSEAVITKVGQELASAIPQTGLPGKEKTIGNYVKDLQFNNGTVIVVPKTGVQSDAFAPRVKDTLRMSGEAIKRLVMVGAHMEGTTKYKEYWEANRHLIVPSLYVDPQKFPPGFVNPKTGWKFKGGVWEDVDNWEKPASGPKP